MKISRFARGRFVLALAALVLLASAAVAAVPQTRWRARLLWMQATGQIPDITLTDIVTYMLPGSEQSLERLIETQNPYAVIRNAHTAPPDLEAGSRLYRERCASCHGPEGGGGPQAPALTGRTFKHGESDWAVYRTIRHGVRGTAMPAFPNLEETQRWQLVSFLRFIDVPESLTVNPGAALTRNVNVPYEELARIEQPGDDWLTYSGSYTGTRHSSLTQITDGNVHQLGMAWIHQFRGEPRIEATPLVRDGVMYVSVPPCSVHALDARTGSSIWEWSCGALKTERGGEQGLLNRGVAILDNRIFTTTWDARLFAIDASTGKQLWEATVHEDFDVYFITGAPLAFRDLVVTGISTRDVGRGVLAAFDAATGKQRWRFFSVPGEGEPGNDTWEGDSWTRGGGPTWLTGSYDAQEDLLYWGVGNPKPDYDATVRKGDNLYTNSVVALRGSTGELVWHFQFVPHDDKDWGANQVPVLVQNDANGSVEKRLLWANRNGFYYVFDRLNGKFLHGRPFVRQTWAKGLDPHGRPIPIAVERRDEGQMVYPGNVGGTHWWSPTYYPPRRLMIVPVLEQGMVYFSSFNSPPRASGRSFFTAVRALDSQTGDLVWEHRRTPRFTENFMPGLMSTAGGVVFGSDQSTFFALAADTGRLVWSTQTGGSIIANPITYEVDGRQLVTIAAGGDLLSFALPASPVSPDPNER